jgi:hypothetical protein
MAYMETDWNSTMYCIHMNVQITSALMSFVDPVQT